jgi:hypothetical protein
MYRISLLGTLLAVAAVFIGASSAGAQNLPPMNLAQQTAHDVVQPLAPGLVHGPEMNFFIAMKDPRNLPGVRKPMRWVKGETYINSDCEGAARYGIVPNHAMRLFTYRRYGTSECNAWLQFDPFKIPNDPYYRRPWRADRRRALKTAYERLKDVERRNTDKYDYFHIPRRHIWAARGGHKVSQYSNYYFVRLYYATHGSHSWRRICSSEVRSDLRHSKNVLVLHRCSGQDDFFEVTV